MNGIFHPAIVSWFSERYGTPTTVQSEAWPIISRGENVLVVAPTGTGKTLTAFLWALNQLITGTWTCGRTRILYISPLRALNNDIRRNLIVPLRELETLFGEKGLSYPSIDVKTRSGDTPMEERRRMLRYPPEIFITTPESLNLILASPRARGILTGIQTVILDEIHAVVNSKRGVHLMSAVERIVPLCGEFQRIALSATVQPMESVSSFIGGYFIHSGKDRDALHARPVRIIAPEHEKTYEITIRYPEATAARAVDETLWDTLADELLKTIRSRISTLIFANSRRLTERITLNINDHAREVLAYAHHGSLSREIRNVVEQRLKAGELRAIVATNSLELGIDIGSLDAVVLIQSPGSISSAIQRIGRAGHSVGSVSSGTIYPTHPFDIIESAVIARAVKEHDIEPVRPIQNALDVLAQIIISMVVVEPWDIDEMFQQIRRCFSYHSLPRTHFDLVVQMLEGSYEHSRIRELKPRILVDRIDNTITALGGARIALYSSGGVIPDRGYYRLRTQDSGALIGDLDEEFVWEAKRGQVFTLGTQNWQIERITHNDVLVRPASPAKSSAPFWKGEQRSRDPHFSALVGGFLEYVDARLDNAELHDELSREFLLEETARDQIIDFLRRQRQHTGCPLPHRHHLVIEHIDTGPGGVPGKQIVLHTLWGSNINMPYAFALEKAWEERYGDRPRLHATNNTITIIPSEDIPECEIQSLVSGSMVEDLLRSYLPESGIFGAHFRENAGRALLLGPRKFGERMPLWMSRLHSQKLMDAVVSYRDFPIMLETWRSIIEDEFDLTRLSILINEIEDGRIVVSESRSAYPSPFAQAAAWNQINEYMYMGDGSGDSRQRETAPNLIHDLLSSGSVRPRILEWIINDFEKKRLLLYSGYRPGSETELLAYIKERGLVPYQEWMELIQSIINTTNITHDRLEVSLQGKLCAIHVPRTRHALICTMERVHELVSNVYGDRDDIEVRELWSDVPVLLDIASPIDHRETIQTFLSEWLGFYGPRSSEGIGEDLGIPRRLLLDALIELRDAGRLFHGILRENGNVKEYCDAENLETLLRIQRRSRRRLVSTIDSKWLPLFLAVQQGIASTISREDEIISVIDRLSLYPLPAWLWESDILMTRCPDYRTEWIDRLFHRGVVSWIGHGKEQIMLCYPDDLDLIRDEHVIDGHEDRINRESAGDDLFPDREARYDFPTLLRRTDYDAASLSNILWNGVWDGLLSNTGFDVVRQGVRNRFAVKHVQTESMSRFRTIRVGRRHFSRWRGSLPEAGLWFRIKNKYVSRDLLDDEEIKKERVRLLLGRYGILCRELLRRELPSFSWSELFKTMRVMELSGEITGGHFFKGLSGPQFIHLDAAGVLDALPNQSLRFWLNAADPISVCGLTEIGDARLPRRLPVNHVVYNGAELICVSLRHGKCLDFFIDPDDPDMEICLDLLMHLFTRPMRSLRKIRIETINGESASDSPYESSLRARFEIQKDRQTLIMHRSFI